MPGVLMGRLLVITLLFAALLSAPAARAVDPNPASIHSTRGAWPLYRQWNRAEQMHFAKWIEHIYDMKRNGSVEQRLAKLEQVLSDPEMNLLLDPAFVGEHSNPQLELSTIRSMHQIVDCAKLTISLSAYYSYMRGLPWMHTSIRSGDGSDIRTSPYNVPAGTFSSFDYTDKHRFFVDVVVGFCTGNYRVEPFRQGGDISDTVPIAINRQFLVPGTVFYMDGHVLILAKTDAQGELYFLDSTTSPTRGIYTQHNFNAVTGIIPAKTGSPEEAYAGCFRGFRVQRYPIAEVDATGAVLKVRRRTDEEMKEFGYSTEQYDKLAELVRTQHIREGNLALDSLHEFIRCRMRTATSIDPAGTINRFADEFLSTMRQREELVQRAWADVQANGSIAFPDGLKSGNAFDAKGRWGDFATAEIDANFRMRYFEMLSELDSAMEWFEHQPGYVKFARQDVRTWTPYALACVLRDLKTRVFKAKTFSYTNSAGRPVRLSLFDVEQRLFGLSFDPNQAPELRWGATAGTVEAATAKDSPTALPDGSNMPMWEAYRRQAFYRTLSFRESEESYLRGMATEGFSVRYTLDQQLAKRWNIQQPPALLPFVSEGAVPNLQHTASRM